MPIARRVLIDTNVFLAAADEGRPERGNAIRALEDWPAGGVALYTTTQVLREFLVVATRPASANGLGLAPPDALRDAAEFAEVVTVLPETLATWQKLLELVQDLGITGVCIHDASIAACALTNGIGAVVTGNAADFDRLPVDVVGLTE
ncbi:MAG: PIN domain-containing protein [Bifidobacteriaceae bacterium]|jgi:predicted nucleic acid-binding protein|nr:PIN domain-containing protein [Bifidobacteriaceae bacterium]